MNHNNTVYKRNPIIARCLIVSNWILAKVMYNRNKIVKRFKVLKFVFVYWWQYIFVNVLCKFDEGWGEKGGEIGMWL